MSGHSGEVLSVSFNSDGTLLASGSEDKTIKLWNVATGQEIKTFYGHSGGVNSISFSPDNTQIASGGEDTIIKLWAIVNDQRITTFSGHSSVVSSGIFSSDGTLLSRAVETKPLTFGMSRQTEELRHYTAIQ